MVNSKRNLLYNDVFHDYLQLANKIEKTPINDIFTVWILGLCAPLQVNQFSFSERNCRAISSYPLWNTVILNHRLPHSKYMWHGAFIYMLKRFLTYPHKFLQKLVWITRTNPSQLLQRFVFYVLISLLSFCLFLSFSSLLIYRCIIGNCIYHIDKNKKKLLWHWKFCTRTIRKRHSLLISTKTESFSFPFL